MLFTPPRALWTVRVYLTAAGVIRSGKGSERTFVVSSDLYRDFRSSGVLCSVDWQVVTDVSGQPVGPICKGQTVQQDLR